MVFDVLLNFNEVSEPYLFYNLKKPNELKISTLFFFSCMLFLISNKANAQVTVSNSDEVVAQSQTSLTLNFTVAAGTDRLLLVSTGSDLTTLSLTYDGTPMVLETVSGGGSLWTLPLGTNVSVGTTADIVFTINGSTPAQYLAISAIAYEGVDQLTPVENITSQPIIANATSSVLTIASKPNDLVYDGVLIGCLPCFSAPIAVKTLAATTVRNSLDFLGLGFAGRGESGTTIGAASVSPGWNFSGSSVANGVHNGLNIRNSIALPVELSTFDARPIKENILLEWTTSSETNNAGFEVERSTDGENFQNITFLPSRGTTTTVQRYQFTDVRPPKGMLYFRLKQLDYNGDFEYSKVVAIEMKQQAFTLFPNPAKNEIQIETQDLESARLNIFNGQGQLLKHFDLENDQSTLDITDLPNGLLIAVIIVGDQVHTRNLIKME